MPELRIIRHRRSDRLMHWLMAALILILLATGLLPVLGFSFNWVPWHWISGVIMTLLLLGHIVRSLFFKKAGSMWIAVRDFSVLKPGKYSLAQKLMHHAVALLSLTAVSTGLLLMIRIETPFWERNPYWLQADTWGLVYVLHGLAALVFITVIMLHIYFSVRPEKRMYLRAMVKGWMTAEEYRSGHDPQFWQAEHSKGAGE